MSSTKNSSSDPANRRRRERLSGRRNWLTLWRWLSPRELQAIPSAPDELLAFLAARSVPQTDAQKELLAGMLSGRQVAACALQMARLCSSMFDVPTDATMSWVLLSALRHHEPAILALSQALRDRALHQERKSKEAASNGDPVEAIRGYRRAATRARATMIAWAEEIQLCVLNAPLAWLDRFEPPHVGAEKEGDAPTLAVTSVVPMREEVPTGPTLQVIQEIAFPDAEHQGVAASYRHLTEPLPLRGAAVLPEVLRSTLLLEFPHMSEAIARIVDDLTLRHWAGFSWTHLTPLLLVGPPGVGKSRFARRLARLLGTGYAALDVAGSTDNRMLQGTARGWKGAQPAWPLLAMLQTGCANPLLVIDELDKAGASRSGGDVKNTMLAWLEPETARAWRDECLLAPADMSQVSWIMTANELSPIPPALLSRLQIVHVARPDADAFDAIFAGILRDLASELRVPDDALPTIDDDLREVLRQALDRGVSVRAVQRTVRTVVARSAKGPPRRH